MRQETFFASKVHHGNNIKRFRAIQGIKQQAIANALQITQQAVSDLEKKEEIDDDTLEIVAQVLNIPVEAIKNFREGGEFIFTGNNFNDIFHDNSSFIMYQPAINHNDNNSELINQLLKAVQELNALTLKLLSEMNKDKS